MDISAHGHLRKPNLHDGHLLGIALVGEATLHVHLRDLAGKRHMLELSGLKRLRCGEFREGNIILDVQITCGTPSSPGETEIRQALVRSLVGELHSTVQDPVIRSKHENSITKLLASIESGSLTLVRIDPSYGCELTALCEKVVFA